MDVVGLIKAGRVVSFEQVVRVVMNEYGVDYDSAVDMVYSILSEEELLKLGAL